MLGNMISISQGCRLFFYLHFKRVIKYVFSNNFQKLWRWNTDINETLQFLANTMKWQCSHNLYEFSVKVKLLSWLSFLQEGEKTTVQKTNIFLELRGRKQGANFYLKNFLFFQKKISSRTAYTIMMDLILQFIFNLQ